MARIRLPLAALAAVLVACSGDETTNPTEPVASVTIDPGVREVVAGQTLGLTATIRSAAGKPLTRPIVWSTNDASVATVSTAGVVLGVGAGSAEIVAAVEGRSDTATVVVTAFGAVASVELNYTNVDLEEGHAFIFTPTAKDAEGNVVTGRVPQWSSSAPEVASVNPIGLGRVLPIKPGVTTITVTIDGRAASAEVEVYAAYPFELVYELAGAVGESGLFQLDINDPTAHPLRLLPDPYTAGRISPDGARIAYVATGAGGHSAIWVADRNGLNPRQLTTGPGQHDQPTWSPDGTRLAYRRWHWQAGEGSDIWTIAVDGQSAPVNVTQETAASEREPAWSREVGGASRIAYVRLDQGQASIWVMHPDGTGKAPVTAGPADAEPAWSPGADLIVFQRSGVATFGDLYLADLEGGEPWLLVTLPQIQRAPTFSPDGRLVAFASGHEGGGEQIYTVAPEGNRLARRTSGTGVHGKPMWVMK